MRYLWKQLALIVALLAFSTSTVTEVMAGTDVYECTPKAIFGVGYDGLPEDEPIAVLPQAIMFDVPSGLLLQTYESLPAQRYNFTVVGRGLPGQSTRSDGSPDRLWYWGL